MLSILRYLRGYLRICVTGYAPERFMNLCNVYGICLWDIEDIFADASAQETEQTTGKMMNISVSDFFRLKTIARKTRTRVHIIRKYGFPFFLKKVGQHKVFATGLFACLICLYMLSKFIWTIEIEGNLELTDDIFHDFLMTQNIAVGMKIDDLDIDRLEKSLRNEYDYITWASAKIIGTRLIVSIKENNVEKTTDTDSLPEPTDLVAEKSGVIISMITRNGVPLKKIGDEVSVGEVLVSGRIPILNDDETIKGWHECHADADIIIETSEKIQIKQNQTYIDKQPTGNVHKRWGIKIGSIFWELGQKTQGENWEAVREYQQLKLTKDFYLPVFYGQTVYTEYQKKTAKYTENELKQLLLEKYNLYEQKIMEKGIQIIEKNVKIVRKNDAMYMVGVVRQNIKIGQNIPSASDYSIEMKEETEIE